jgi:hypothetical protein
LTTAEFASARCTIGSSATIQRAASWGDLRDAIPAFCINSR